MLAPKGTEVINGRSRLLKNTSTSSVGSNWFDSWKLSPILGLLVGPVGWGMRTTIPGAALSEFVVLAGPCGVGDGADVWFGGAEFVCSC